MIKIAITVRNRLGITKKCIEALLQHTTIPHQIYIYDNLTDYKLENHFAFYHTLLKKKLIHQVTFNTNESCYGAFSKAISLNQFGLNHEQDPDKNKCEMLVTLDNDIIVMPKWHEILLRAFQDINQQKIKNVYVIAQYLGGAIKYGKWLDKEIAGYKAYHGKLGGSCLWASRTNFYDKVGYLDPKPLVGFNKKHDQHYWTKMETLTHGSPYILGLDAPLLLRGGPIAGSVCNVIGYGSQPHKLKQVQYQENDEYINSMNFQTFYRKLYEAYEQTLKNKALKKMRGVT
jgi:hypothetical protein